LTQILQGTTDPDITVRAQKELDEAIEAAGNSCACLPTKAGITQHGFRGWQHPGKQKTRQEGARESHVRGQERGEQEGADPGRPQHEPEARSGPLGIETRGLKGPQMAVIFFSGQVEQFGPEWSRGGSYSTEAGGR
jgi:hypothetical protein